MNNSINITETTTLGELLAILKLGEKPAETPKPKELRETAGELFAEAEGCKVYRNGWAVYDNGSGRTVVWLPDCVSFTYHFDKPSYKQESYVSDRETLPQGLLSSQPWPIAVTLVGDHRVEENLMNRTGSRAGSKVYDDPDFDFGEDEDIPGNSSYLKRFFQEHEWTVENPETVYIRKEEIRELLDAMTEKQRKVVVQYFIYGYSLTEIARKVGIKKAAVCRLISRAEEKARFSKNIFPQM